MTFGYEYRPSLWRKIRNHSHLVIAGAGTLSFLCIAGIALWLAMPSIERSAFANSRQEAALQPLEATQPAAAAKAVPPATGAATATTVVQNATVPPAPSDVRWKDPNAPKDPAPAPAQTSTQAVNSEAGDAAVSAEANPSLSAFAAANRAQVAGDQPPAPPAPAAAKPDDGAETAAIPAVKPNIQDDDPEDEADNAPAAAEPSNDAKAAQGHIVHGVTMRAAPKKGAAAMTTIPAKTAVQVLNCAQWCQVVYNGKRGWVYKSFVTRDN